MLPEFILHPEPDEPIVEVRFPDGQNVFYSLEGIPPEQWELTIAAMRREAQAKYDRGEPVDAKTFQFRFD
jgi:hypothetical protein